jgi:hypothetical protein
MTRSVPVLQTSFTRPSHATDLWRLRAVSHLLVARRGLLPVSISERLLLWDHDPVEPAKSLLNTATVLAMDRFLRTAAVGRDSFTSGSMSMVSVAVFAATMTPIPTRILGMYCNVQ